MRGVSLSKPPDHGDSGINSPHGFPFYERALSREGSTGSKNRFGISTLTFAYTFTYRAVKKKFQLQTSQHARFVPMPQGNFEMTKATRL